MNTQYGISETKRNTVEAAEQILGENQQFLKHGEFMLVDYMGGDAAIENAATNYKGLGAVNNPGQKDFFMHLRQNGINRPFQFAEVKLGITSPLYVGEKFVPFEGVNVNEYSARYSEVPNIHFNPLQDNSQASHEISNQHDDNMKAYEQLLELGLAKELARSVLTPAVFTRYYWKANLESTFDFIKQNQDPHPQLQPYMAHLIDAVKRVAPNAYAAFESVDLHGERTNADVRFEDNKVRSIERKLTDPYGISETGRITVPEAEEQMFKKTDVLDDGWVAFTDYMGADHSITEAARTSYGKGTKKAQDNKGLSRYLYRNLHTTPYEMIEVAFAAQLPRFIMRQLIRHRTLDKTPFMNEYFVDKIGYVPDVSELREQSTVNKQGRGGELSDEKKKIIQSIFQDRYGAQQSLMKKLEQDNYPHHVSREVAPVGSYTSWSVKGDVKNLFHMLGLRLDSHAQKESQVYAHPIADAVKSLAPTAWSAFEDYHQNATRISGPEKEVIKLVVDGANLQEAIEISGIKNKREISELESKLSDLGIFDKSRTTVK